MIRGEGLAEPHGSVLSPDGSRLYVANRTRTGSYASSDRMGYDAPGGTVVVIDTESREIIDVIETPPYASGIGLASSRAEGPGDVSRMAVLRSRRAAPRR